MFGMLMCEDKLHGMGEAMNGGGQTVLEGEFGVAD